MACAKFPTLILTFLLFAVIRMCFAYDYSYSSVLDDLHYAPNLMANISHQKQQQADNLDLDFIEPNVYQFTVDNLNYEEDITLDIADANLFKIKQTQIDALSQYYFYSESKVTPYLGAGLNYIKLSASNACDDYTDVQCAYDKSSINAIFQAGFNYGLSSNLNLNIEAKMPFANLKYDLDAKNNNFDNSTLTNQLNYSPLILGIGLGYAF